MRYWQGENNREKGYPSGYAGGLALEGHPELEAKGFYMVRRLAMKPKHSVFHLDDESGDKTRFEWYDFREESVRGPKCRKRIKLEAGSL